MLFHRLHHSFGGAVSRHGRPAVRKRARRLAQGLRYSLGAAEDSFPGERQGRVHQREVRVPRHLLPGDDENSFQRQVEPRRQMLDDLPSRQGVQAGLSLLPVHFRFCEEKACHRAPGDDGRAPYGTAGPPDLCARPYPLRRERWQAGFSRGPRYGAGQDLHIPLCGEILYRDIRRRARLRGCSTPRDNPSMEGVRRGDRADILGLPLDEPEVGIPRG